MVEDGNVKALIAKHSGNGLLIDTNLLLLLAVWNYSCRRIESFKRTSAYDRSDLQLLLWLIAHFQQLWATPNVLSEVDNLGRRLNEREWPEFAASIASLVTRINEEFVKFSLAVKSRTFARLGLTDTVTLSMGRPFLLLSDDVNLCLAAQTAGYDAINFNHLRS